MTKNYNIGVAPSTPIQSVFNQTLSKLGPKVVPQNVDLTTASGLELDLSPLVQNGNIDFVSGAWVDNSANDQVLNIAVAGSKQNIIVPANTQGYFPMLSPNNPIFTFSCATSPGLIIPVIFYNIPLLPYMWNASTGSGMPVTGDWLTNAQLRATAVSVTGPLTNTQLRATAVPVLLNGAVYVDRSIASLTGASEMLMTANSGRKVAFIQNVSANNMGVNLTGGTAAVGGAGTVTLIPGAALTLDSNCPQNAITIIGTAADVVTAFEG